jgi:hypothetical protein
MTDEEVRTWEVLAALEDFDLAEAREEIASFLHDRWQYWDHNCFPWHSPGEGAWEAEKRLSPSDMRDGNAVSYVAEALNEALGEEATATIFYEELEKFKQSLEPEQWRIYAHGTPQEVRAYKIAKAKIAAQRSMRNEPDPGCVHAGCGHLGETDARIAAERVAERNLRDRLRTRVPQSAQLCRAVYNAKPGQYHDAIKQLTSAFDWYLREIVHGLLVDVLDDDNFVKALDDPDDVSEKQNIANVVQRMRARFLTLAPTKATP